MARIQKLTRNDVAYLYVVEEDYSSGHRKIKSVKTYGRYTPELEIEAKLFVVNFNTLEEIAKQKIKSGESPANVKNILAAAGYLVIGVLGSEGLKYLFQKYIQ